MLSAERTLVRLAQAFAILTVFVFAVMSGPPFFSNASITPSSMPSPMIGLQFARSVQQVDNILGEAPSPDREAARIKLYQGFAFIPSYVGLCIFICLALGKSNLMLRKRAASGIFAIISAGTQDVLENLRTLRLVNLKLVDTETSLLDLIRLTAVTKWLMVAVTIAIIGYVFFKTSRQLTRAVGAVTLLGSLLVVIGLFLNPVLQFGLVLMAAGLLASAATLKFAIRNQHP